MNTGTLRRVVLSINNISKTFPGGITAIEEINLDLYEGEIVALLGENGSGKSTLVKILYGVYTPDSGEIKILTGDKLSRVNFGNPVDAMKHGIILVNQTPQLIDKLSVAENIAITLSTLRSRDHSGFTSISETSKLLKEVSESTGIRVDPNEKAYNLTYSQKQFIELLRAIIVNAKIFLLDEALSYLPIAEKKRFYDILYSLKNSGKTVLLITHKIQEAFDLSDRIVILRKGRIVGVLETKNTTVDEVRRLMFGETNNKYITNNNWSNPEEEHVIEVEDLAVRDDHGREVLSNITFCVGKGEIAGIIGVAGSGQRELVESIVGLRKPIRGKITLAGVDVVRKGIKAVREAGVGYIPDQPLKQGIACDNSIVENIAIMFSSNPILINWDIVKEKAVEIVKNYNVQSKSIDSPVKTLSGGNIMKVIIGKELSYAKQALIACNPTRALDELSANNLVSVLKYKAHAEKLSVLIASEDIDEVLTISDAVYVLNSGRLIGPFQPSKVPRERIEELMVA